MIQPNFVAAYIIDPDAMPEPLILMIKRAPEAYLPNMWQMVTGKVANHQKETVLEALKREVFEETGLIVNEGYNVHVSLFYDKIKDQVAFEANFLIFKSCKEKITVSPREHSEYMWCPIDEAVDKLVFSTHKENLLHIQKYYLLQKPANKCLLFF